jgi:hypothetical protein
MKCLISIACVLIFAFASLATEPAIDVTGKPGPVEQLPWLHEGLRLSYKVTDARARGNEDIVEGEDGKWPDFGYAGAGVSIAQFTVAGLTDRGSVAATVSTNQGGHRSNGDGCET